MKQTESICRIRPPQAKLFVREIVAKHIVRVVLLVDAIHGRLATEPWRPQTAILFPHDANLVFVLSIVPRLHAALLLHVANQSSVWVIRVATPTTSVPL